MTSEFTVYADYIVILGSPAKREAADRRDKLVLAIHVGMPLSRSTIHPVIPTYNLIKSTQCIILCNEWLYFFVYNNIFFLYNKYR